MFGQCSSDQPARLSACPFICRIGVHWLKSGQCSSQVRLRGCVGWSGLYNFLWTQAQNSVLNSSIYFANRQLVSEQMTYSCPFRHIIYLKYHIRDICHCKSKLQLEFILWVWARSLVSSFITSGPGATLSAYGMWLTLYHTEPLVKWLGANSKKPKQPANNSQAV